MHFMFICQLYLNKSGQTERRYLICYCQKRFWNLSDWLIAFLDIFIFLSSHFILNTNINDRWPTMNRTLSRIPLGTKGESYCQLYQHQSLQNTKGLGGTGQTGKTPQRDADIISPGLQTIGGLAGEVLDMHVPPEHTNMDGNFCNKAQDHPPCPFTHSLTIYFCISVRLAAKHRAPIKRGNNFCAVPKLSHFLILK